MSLEDKLIQDVVEKYVTDGFKREVDYEEAVWRTLPPFITVLGFIAACLSYLTSKLWSPWYDPVELTCIFLMLFGLGSSLRAGWYLSYAIRGRKNRYPMDELALYNWAILRTKYNLEQNELRELAINKSEMEIKDKILSDIAESASHNHKINAKKMTARTFAARWLFISAVSTLAAGATISLCESPLMANIDHARQRSTIACPTIATGASASPSAGAKMGGKRGTPGPTPKGLDKH